MLWKWLIRPLQDNYESADTAIDGNDLDVGSQQKVPSPETMGEHAETDTVINQDSEGLSVFMKLFFFGAILGAVALFLRTRGPAQSQRKEKSMA